MNVELRLDQVSRPRGEVNAQVAVVEQPLDGRGERGWLVLGHQQPRVPGTH